MCGVDWGEGGGRRRGRGEVVDEEGEEEVEGAAEGEEAVVPLFGW